MSDYPTSPCKSCRRLVIWTTTERGKPMPVDAQPDPAGSVALSIEDGKVHSRVVSVKLRFGRKDLHTSHFVGCPQSGKWRRRR